MENVALLVEHVEGQRVIRGRYDGEAGSRTAEDRAFDRGDLAAERTGRIDHVVDVAARHAEVLEIVDMAADVHVHAVFAQDRIQTLLQVEPLLLVLAGFGVDGVVADDDLPGFIGLLQRRVDPAQLFVDVLRGNVPVGFLRFLVVLVDQRRGVDPNHAQGGGVAHLETFGVVAVGHHPAAADVAVVEDGLRVAPVLVVAENRIPVEHQFGVGVDQFVVGHPERVVYAGHALEVVNVAGSGHKLDVDLLGQFAHRLGDRFLVVVAVASQVVGNDEVEIVFVDRGQPLGRIRRSGRSSVAGGQHPRAGQQQEKCTVDFHILVLLWFCRGSGRFRSPISDPA